VAIGVRTRRAPSGRAARRGQSAAIQPPLVAIECLDAEAELRAAGYSLIAGVDEVGRGCWAGPVYAGVVVLPTACYENRQLLAEVTDSKLLTAAKRERLAEDILGCATAAAVAWATAPLVDRLNVLGATRLAMGAALRCLSGPATQAGPGWGARRLTQGDLAPDYVLLDAVKLPEVPLPQRAVVRGDRSCLAIAAASIVAKVERDAELRRCADAYPDFDFASNKGYGTRRHLDALRRHGLTPLHRRTFAPAKYLLGLRDHMAGALPAPPEALAVEASP
jgi:ribonuclease HII